MTDQELNALIAEKIMGWERHAHSAGVDWWYEKEGAIGSWQWQPSINLNQCWEAEQKMWDGKHVVVYMRHLAEITGANDTVTGKELESRMALPSLGRWLLSTATPRQRCQAMAKVVA